MTEALLSIHVEALPEGGFLATSDELPGLLAQGRTVAETLEIAQDVARPLRRTVQRKIENPLARRILAGDFTEGDTAHVDYDGADYTFEKLSAAPARAPEPVAATA